MTAPQRIGPYAVERLLGVGSFATVWLGYDAVLDARVAIKVLAENWSHDLRVRERFLDEARLLRRLEHERLIRVHTVGELPDGRPYAVLAWADRGSLRDRLTTGEIPAPTALRLLGEVCAGVAVLHRHGVVHRDLTPGNVLFRSTGPDAPEAVLIADLGLAKALATASGLTARAGTPGYMAPEQDDPGAVVDTRADVYGLGRLGVRLLAADPSGTHPARPNPPHAPRIRLRDGLPPGIAAVLARATAYDPADRYPDAAALHAALARASDPVREPADPVAASARRRPAPRRARRSLLTGVAVVTALAVGQVAAEPGWHRIGSVGRRHVHDRAADRGTAARLVRHGDDLGRPVRRRRGTRTGPGDVAATPPLGRRPPTARRVRRPLRRHGGTHHTGRIPGRADTRGLRARAGPHHPTGGRRMDGGPLRLRPGPAADRRVGRPAPRRSRPGVRADRPTAGQRSRLRGHSARRRTPAVGAVSGPPR
ncbi:serine/threonine-protein kinase [Micromonospora sp. MH99]|uniref:serine/threonine-protein kinase n=1 Tax=Micromonospora sp. MH99 TaxID=1945510 RepID=UPI001F2C9507|nr:serine/threonine-protein kinase [Micromonospora sp. MH99]